MYCRMGQPREAPVATSRRGSRIHSLQELREALMTELRRRIVRSTDGQQIHTMPS